MTGDFKLRVMTLGAGSGRLIDIQVITAAHLSHNGFDICFIKKEITVFPGHYLRNISIYYCQTVFISVYPGLFPGFKIIRLAAVIICTNPSRRVV
jgi:hypothetical protein